MVFGYRMREDRVVAVVIFAVVTSRALDLAAGENKPISVFTV
jgi:hypothetical protein